MEDAMKIKKWIPWNWFKKEEEDSGSALPVQHKSSQDTGLVLRNSIEQFHRQIDKIFDDALRGWGSMPSAPNSAFLPGTNGGLLRPTLDLGASDEEYTVTVEIPGVDEKEIKLEIANDTLTIQGEKRQKNEETGKNYYRMERSYGSFQRVLALPEDADQDGVTASFKNGILSVTMPRKPLPKSDVKRIEVKSA